MLLDHQSMNKWNDEYTPIYTADERRSFSRLSVNVAGKPSIQRVDRTSTENNTTHVSNGIETRVHIASDVYTYSTMNSQLHLCVLYVDTFNREVFTEIKLLPDGINGAANAHQNTNTST